MSWYLSLVFFLVCNWGLFTYAQLPINCDPIELKNIPAQITYSGQTKKTIGWSDKLGQFILIITETGEVPSINESDDNYRDASIYAYCFSVVSDSVHQIWKIQDFVKECPVDIMANFIKDDICVTDLDHNGIAEVWIVYKIGCFGDVSPIEMKIIMYQGTNKFAMRGHTQVRISQDSYEGGEYKFDSAFINGASEFRKFAKRLWEKNIASE